MLLMFISASQAEKFTEEDGGVREVTSKVP
jgi:hypothetical protein